MRAENCKLKNVQSQLSVESHEIYAAGTMSGSSGYETMGNGTVNEVCCSCG